MKSVTHGLVRAIGGLLPRDDTSWAERSAYWLKQSAPKPQRFIRRGGIRHPLVLSGHGVRLAVDHGSLWVQNGFTHYPQQRETWRFFPGDWRLPSQIVALDVDGGLSFDALAWLSEHNVPLIQIDWRGRVVNVAGATAKMMNSRIAKAQLRAQTGKQGLHIAQRLVREKLTNSMDTLRHAFARSPAIDLALDKIGSELRLLKRQPPRSINKLMGVEGRVGLAYFSAWRGHPIRWKGTERRPIPEDWHQIGRRSSKVADKFHPNRTATHPMNAMLNYAYAVLESKVRMQVLAAGLDLTIGFLHHGTHRGKQGLVYDFMEPLRPIADREILQFVQSCAFHPADFSIRGDGVCRLNPEIAKHVTRLVTVRLDKRWQKRTKQKFSGTLT